MRRRIGAAVDTGKPLVDVLNPTAVLQRVDFRALMTRMALWQQDALCGHVLDGRRLTCQTQLRRQAWPRVRPVGRFLREFWPNAHQR